MISLARHIDIISSTNPFIKQVRRHNQERLIRISVELYNTFQITNAYRQPKAVADEIRLKMKNNHTEAEQNHNSAMLRENNPITLTIT